MDEQSQIPQPVTPVVPAPPVAPSAPATPTPAPATPSPAVLPTPPTAAPSAPGAFPPPPADGEDLQTVDGPMPGKYKIFIHRSKCISAGSCIAIAPNALQFDEHNIATVISQNELDDIKLLAAQSCPVLAVVVQDMTTGQVVWPEQG